MIPLRLSTKTKVKIAHYVFRTIRFGRSLVGKPSSGVFLRNGVRWELDLSEGIDLAIFLFGAFEVQTTRFFRSIVRPGDIILDIGANIGAHTLPLAKNCGEEGRVHAFEATSFAYKKLRRNMELNPALAKRINAIHSLLTDKLDGEIETEIVSSWSLVSSPEGRDELAGVPKSVGEAEVMTLDGWAERTGLSRLDLIKIDVDGHEPIIFAGAMGVIRRFRPKILMELAPYCHTGSPQRLHDQMLALERMGYRFRSLAKDARSLPFEQLAATVQKEGSINVFAEVA